MNQETTNGEAGGGLGAARGSAWRECAKAWRAVADSMQNTDQELSRRAMARAETFEYCANTLDAETPNAKLSHDGPTARLASGKD